MDSGRYYKGIKQIQTVVGDEAVNSLLASGWELLKSEIYMPDDPNRIGSVSILGLNQKGLETGSPPSAPAKPSAGKPDRSFITDCNKCGEQIRLAKYGDKWKPESPEGGSHGCITKNG